MKMGSYGVQSIIHTPSIMRLSEDLPVVIEVVETEERLLAVFPELKKMMKNQLNRIQDLNIMTGHESAPDLITPFNIISMIKR